MLSDWPLVRQESSYWDRERKIEIGGLASGGSKLDDLSIMFAMTGGATLFVVLIC